MQKNNLFNYCALIAQVVFFNYFTINCNIGITK